MLYLQSAEEVSSNQRRAGHLAPRRPVGTIWRNRAKISLVEPGVASCRQVGDNSMASLSQLNPYHCDQCGAANVVAAPVLYQQGTHSYSTRFYTGTTQSFSAKAAAPPDPRGYGRPLLLWGIPICFTLFWGFVGLVGILDHSKSAMTLGNTVVTLLLIGSICICGMLLNFRRIARYNQQIYPKLQWNWEHTYFCRRCGRFRLISP
jgi:hypothetical protein